MSVYEHLYGQFQLEAAYSVFKILSCKTGTLTKLHKYNHSLLFPLLSYDVAVFLWITPCKKKSYDHTYIKTFAGICNVIEDFHNNNVNFH